MIAADATLTYASSAAQSFTGFIDGAGGLTQAGPGTLTIDDYNGYTGPTTISGGNLRVTGDSIVDSGTLVISGTCTIEPLSDETVDELFSAPSNKTAEAGEPPVREPTISTTTIPSGQPGSSMSPVLPSAARRIDTWATDNELTELNNGADQDADEDGANNLVEFAFNGDLDQVRT